MHYLTDIPKHLLSSSIATDFVFKHHVHQEFGAQLKKIALSHPAKNVYKNRKYIKPENMGTHLSVDSVFRYRLQPVLVSYIPNTDLRAARACAW